ncbi:SGT1 protein-domain-containing protein [Gautieria morchelliformis]|nr:SGT1 protein-domain-containing protein [Gautieria morchelliformis]
MDIFNRPPTIAEDTLHYTLHPGPSFPDKSAVTTLATLIHSHVSSLLPKHIWHRDAFELKVVNSPYSPEEWIIEGRMRVGDCVDDEWCVVWLLRDITRQWDVAVNVFDSDGDFLLIEAAEHLPAWVTPSNSENRVWIFTGRLHLVPLQYISSSASKQERRMLGGAGSDDDDDSQKSGAEYISMADAISIVRNATNDTLATPDVQRFAFRRIEGYPESARQHVHHAKAYVPIDIPYALSVCPSLIQKATEAFYTRDALQLRAANRMARFPPDSSVLATVTMTRTAYAQLMGQRFHPPKAFGQFKEKEGSSEWRWRDIGMKIACGFEMIYQETGSRHENTADRLDITEVSVEARREALRRDPEYVRYIKNLQQAGFFKNEIEGSSLWKDQENQAATQFIHSRQTDNASRPSFASLVNSAVSQARMQRGNGDDLPLLDGEEDSDEWLLIDESMVDNILAHVQMPSGRGEADMDVDNEKSRGALEDKQAAEQADQLRTLASKVESFVVGQGDVEGATFEDEVLSDEADMSELADSDDDSTADSCVDDTAERRAAMDRLVPALESSEYGKMPPSFHRNSQRVKKSSVETVGLAIEDLPEDASPPQKPVRPLIFPRDEFDGVEDSDDESEEEVTGGDEEDEDEDRPQIVGELEVDMQGEAEEFLKFSRETLGISPEMWDDIVQDRKNRDAFIPPSALRGESTQNSQIPTNLTADKPVDSSLETSTSAGHLTKTSDLSSFEAVMQAMDDELSRAKQSKQFARDRASPIVAPAKVNSGNKGKQKADDNDDVGAAMDAELRAAIQDSSDEEDEESPIDYTLMKNFLESFKSQQGLPGPVGNLIGRLGGQLPRDES